MNSIIMHITYCEKGSNEFGKSVEDVCRKAAVWGFDGIEFRAKIPNDLKYNETEYIDAIIKAKKKYNIKQIMFGRGAYGISSDDAEIRTKAINDTIKFFQRVHGKLGVTVCNAYSDFLYNANESIPRYEYDYHGSAAATESQWHYTAEGFQKIGDAIAPLGMRIGFETHMNFIHDTPVATAKLVKMIDSPVIGVNMDYGNTIYFKNYPSISETIKLYGDKLFYVHIKNSIGIRDSGRYPVSLCEGEINYRDFLSELIKVNYKGPIGLEAPRRGDRESFARQDLQYFKAIAKDVGLDCC